MKYILVSLILLLNIFYMQAQSLGPKDSLNILSVIEDWNKGWQIKSFELASRGYAEDAQFTNAFGDKRSGKREIHELLKEVFSLPFVMAGNSETSEHRYQTLSSIIVVVHTTVIRKGQRAPDGQVLPDRQTTHMRIFQKVGENWAVTAHLISDARDKQMPKH